MPIRSSYAQTIGQDRLPGRGQSTFASHFMMNGGNIFVLKEILGHADIKMTMIYSHFYPKHLEDAVKQTP